MSKERAKLNFETTLLMLTNELSMVKTMSHCSGSTSFGMGIENVKSVSNHLPLPRILHNLPRWTSARLSQIECHINTFDAILRKNTFSFI